MEFCCSRCKMTFRSSLLLDKHKEKFCIGGELRKTHDTETPMNMLDRVRDLQRRRSELRRRTEDPLRLEGGQGKEDGHKAGEKPLSGLMRPSSHKDTHSEPSSRALRGSRHGAAVRTEDPRVQLAGLTQLNQNLERQRRDMGLRHQVLSANGRTVTEVEKMLSDLRMQERRNTHLLETLLEHLQQLYAQPLRGTVPSRQRGSHHPTPQRLERHGHTLQPLAGQKSPPQSLEEARHTPQPLEGQRHTHTYVPVYGGGGLSAEISALRLSYLQHGGCEAAILAQLQDLLEDALQLERKERTWPHTGEPYHRVRSKRRQPALRPQGRPSLARLSGEDLWEVEEENRRLQEEIVLAQLRRKKKRSRRTQPSEGHTHHEMSAMKMDLDLLKHEMEIQRLRRQITTTKTPGSPLRFPPLGQVGSETPALQRLSLEALEDLDPAPYDPTAGLVVFYDCVLGLSPVFRVCRLEVGLYSGGQELASPSPLPPAYCQPASLSPTPQHARGSLAIFATRQAVPRLLPSSSISLVLQLQTLGGYDTCGQEVKHLVPQGWSKVDLFDKHNRVLSGRWKVPVRVLPVRPGLTSGEINTIPQLQSAELYLRVVNARDADSQSSELLNLSTMGVYRYPPLVCERTCFSSHLQPSEAQNQDQNQTPPIAAPSSLQRGDPGEPHLLSYLQD